MPNQIGFWGRTWPDQWQPVYPCQYDIDILIDKYGSAGGVPIISMFLTHDWNNKDFGGGTSDGGSGAFITNSWDEASSKCRAFKFPADVREIEGMAFNTSASNRKLMYRYYKSSNGDYRVSSATSLSGWTRERSLGHWQTNANSVSFTIGTIVKTRSVWPIYSYVNSSTGRHLVTHTLYSPPIAPWTSEGILGYIIKYSELQNP